MRNSIDHIVKNYNSDGSKSISPEPVKNAACVGEKINKLGQKEVRI